MIRRLRLAALSGTAVLLCAIAGSQAQQPPPQFPNMTFFITSVGVPAGANFGGLDGADKHCQTLAAICTPRALAHGPLPMRSRAFTAVAPPTAWVLR